MTGLLPTTKTIQGKPCGKGHTGLRRVKKNGKPGTCIECERLNGIDYWERDDVKARRRSKILEKYSLTQDDFDFMKGCQNGKCAICNENHKVIDHSHKTGKVRGLLRIACNVGLGCFKDNINSLKNAIRYLEKDI